MIKRNKTCHNCGIDINYKSYYCDICKKRNCIICGKDISYLEQFFKNTCSMKCGLIKKHNNSITINKCIICNNNFEVLKSRKFKKTCSSKCKGKLTSLLKTGVPKPKEIFHSKCVICEKNIIFYKSSKRKKTCSRECISKLIIRGLEKYRHQPRTEEWKRNISLSQKGEKAHNWQGGKTEINKRLRRGREFKQWREEVFKRDNWTCQHCKQRGGRLHPDHIKPFALYPELRFDVNNGRTLCESCHHKTDTWGASIRKQKRLLDAQELVNSLN